MPLIFGILDTWQDFWMIVDSYGRASHLVNLCRWAKRKKLSGVHRAYQYQLRRELINLKGVKFCRPFTTQWAIVLYKIGQLIVGEPTSYRRGAAHRYRAT